MVPVYSVMSFLALVLPKHAIIFNSIIGIYEALVIYNFLSLCLAWVGGPGEVVTRLSGNALQPSWHLMTCCCAAIPLDGLVFTSSLLKNAHSDYCGYWRFGWQTHH